MIAANQLPVAMTVAEFLDWNPQDSDRWELIDGTPQAMAPASPRHGAIQSESARLIGNQLAESRPACRVITEPGHPAKGARQPERACSGPCGHLRRMEPR